MSAGSLRRRWRRTGATFRQFLAFLTERFGAPPTIADFAGHLITAKRDRSRRCTRRLATMEFDHITIMVNVFYRIVRLTFEISAMH